MDHALALFGNIDTRVLTNAAGQRLTLPAAILSDTWTISLTLYRDIDGELIPRDLDVRRLTVNLGFRTIAPTRGQYRLRAGGTDTEAIDFDAAAEDLLAAIPGATAVTKEADGCYLVTGPSTLVRTPNTETGHNTLYPPSFVRVRGITESGVQSFEVRLIQQPFAFTDTFQRQLGPAPGLDGRTERVFPGALATDEAPALNEVQKLKIPASFRGTYYLTHGYRRTKVISYLDSVTAIAAALNGMWSDGAVRFIVTVPESGYAYIEFTGALGGQPQELLGVTVHSEPPGVITTVLKLDRHAFAAALRAADEIEEVPFEIEVSYIEDDEDPEDPEVEPKRLTFQSTVTCRREGAFDELALYPEHEWARPASDIRYEPASIGQLRVGHTLHYEQAIGDGTSREFSLLHNFDTTNVTGLVVSENIPNGRVLGASEYTAEIVSANELKLTLAVAPGVDELKVSISGAGPAETWNPHNHSATEVFMQGETAPDGETVQDAIEALRSDVAALQEVIGTGEATTLAASALESIAITLPDWTPDPLPAYNLLTLPGARKLPQYPPLPVAVLADLTHGIAVGGPATISTSSVANPTVITTAAAHGLASGQLVTIAGHAGSSPALDGTHVITVTGASTFTIPVNVTSGGTGGTATADTLLAAGTLGQIRRVAATTFAPHPEGLDPVRFEAGTEIVWNGRFWQAISQPSLGTFTADTTNQNLLFAVPHGLAVGARVRVASTGTLPGGLAALTYYFVQAVVSATRVKLSTTSGGSAVSLTNLGSGTHTAFAGVCYPAEFDEPIWGTQVTTAQLAPGMTLSVVFRPKFQLLSPNARGLGRLFIQHAARTVEAGGHLNLAELDWITAKAITIEFGPSMDEHPLVFRVSRSLAGTLSATVRYFNQLEALSGTAIPATADFYVLARWGHFDVQNVPAPVGSLVRECKAMTAAIIPS